jgi:hypothetical protein
VQPLRVDWPVYPRRAEHNTVAEDGSNARPLLPICRAFTPCAKLAPKNQSGANGAKRRPGRKSRPRPPGTRRKRPSLSTSQKGHVRSLKPEDTTPTPLPDRHVFPPPIAPEITPRPWTLPSALGAHARRPAAWARRPYGDQPRRTCSAWVRSVLVRRWRGAELDTFWSSYCVRKTQGPEIWRNGAG